MPMLLSAFIPFFLAPVHAWENHQILMEKLLETQTAKHRMYPYQRIKFPCADQEKKELAELGASLKVDASRIPLFSTGRCQPGQIEGEIVMSEVMTSKVMDEPDQGMDQNLPDADDPKQARKWMGGAHGPTSQGFRHMIFDGILWKHPLTTFQIPLSSVGEALERIQKLRSVSAAYLEKGDKFWGIRTLLWELHYIQDLHQPFHVDQAPSLRMVPWSHLFNDFIAETTHAMGNYHYAYEGIAQIWMKQAQTNDFQKCFEPEAIDDFEPPPPMLDFPRLAGKRVGEALYQILSDAPKERSMDLPHGKNSIDYLALVNSAEAVLPPDEEQTHLTSNEIEAIKKQITRFQAMIELKAVTCQLMSAISRNVWAELDHAFLKAAAQNSSSNKTGKWSDTIPELRRFNP